MKHFSLLVIAALFSCCACREPLPAAEGPHPMMIRFEKDGAEEYFNVAVRDSVVEDAFIVFRLSHYCDHGELWTCGASTGHTGDFGMPKLHL